MLRFTRFSRFILFSLSDPEIGRSEKSATSEVPFPLFRVLVENEHFHVNGSHEDYFEAKSNLIMAY